MLVVSAFCYRLKKLPHGGAGIVVMVTWGWVWGIDASDPLENVLLVEGIEHEGWGPSSAGALPLTLETCHEGQGRACTPIDRIELWTLLPMASF